MQIGPARAAAAAQAVSYYNDADHADEDEQPEDGEAPKGRARRRSRHRRATRSPLDAMPGRARGPLSPPASRALPRRGRTASQETSKSW